MKNPKILIPGFGSFLIIIFALLKVMNTSEKESEKNTGVDEIDNILVSCYTPKLRTIEATIPFSGKIKSVNKVSIISEANGISELSASRFEVGEFFNKGEIILSIQDNEIASELKSIKSDFLALMISVLPDLKSDFPPLGSKFQKYINSFKLSGKMSPLPKTQNSKQRNFLASKKVFATYYRIQALENRLDKYKIKAPFDGVITKALIDEGAPIIIGQPIGEFINTNNYEIVTAVSVSELELINEGSEVIIYSEDLTKQFTGKVKKIGNSINEMTQSIDVFISINDSLIKDGMFVSGSIKGRTFENSYMIHRKNIIETNHVYIQNINFVDSLFVVKENLQKNLRSNSIDSTSHKNMKVTSLKKKEVEGILFHNNSVIIRGLDKNDCIIEQYRNYFYDGMILNEFE